MPPASCSRRVPDQPDEGDARLVLCGARRSRDLREPTSVFRDLRRRASRVAFLDFGPLTPRDTETELRVKAAEQPGLHHVAFTFPSMVSCSTLRSPQGPRDPSVLLRQPRPHDVDVYRTRTATGSSFRSTLRYRRRRTGVDALAAFDQNPIGVEYDLTSS